MTEYVLVKEIKKEAKDVEWWMSQTNDVVNVDLFDSFEDASVAFRKAITDSVKACKFFPLKNGCHKSFVKPDYAEKELADIVNGILSDPDYFCENVDELNYNDNDFGDHYFAFVGTPQEICVENYGRLRFNAHNMKDKYQNYYFKYSQFDSLSGDIINGIDIRLYYAGKEKPVTKTTKKDKAKGYETVTLGKYVQDSAGNKESDITWRVLDRKDDKMMLISEKIIDHCQFSKKNKNNWKNSDVRAWLNSEFMNNAFTPEEQTLILKNCDGDYVSFLTLDEYSEYFNGPNDAKARFTDYSRKKAEEDYHCKIREPYGFWWLKTPNKEGGWGEKGNVYLYHVCGNGILNEYESAEYRDGVRPVIWVKLP